MGWSPNNLVSDAASPVVFCTSLATASWDHTFCHRGERKSKNKVTHQPGLRNTSAARRPSPETLKALKSSSNHLEWECCASSLHCCASARIVKRPLKQTGCIQMICSQYIWLPRAPSKTIKDMSISAPGMQISM